MKTQLKTIALAAVLLSLVAGFSTAMFAQSVNTLHFGGNVSNFIGNDTKFDNKNIYDFKPGFQIGFTKTFGSFLQLEPGIFLVNKGAKFKINSYPGNEDAHGISETLYLYLNLNYLQIPINLKVNFEVEKLCFVVGLGVYGSVGLKRLIKSNNSSFFDFGGQILGGVQYGRFGVNVGWQPGFSRIWKSVFPIEHINSPKIYNNTFFFGLSYAINGYSKANKVD